MKVAVPWLQHSQRFGHWADSQTVWSLRSLTSALVEKKTGLEGSRTLIQSGFFSTCRAGSIFAQDMVVVSMHAAGVEGKWGGWSNKVFQFVGRALRLPTPSAKTRQAERPPYNRKQAKRKDLGWPKMPGAGERRFNTETRRTRRATEKKEE